MTLDPCIYCYYGEKQEPSLAFISLLILTVTCLRQHTRHIRRPLTSVNPDGTIGVFISIHPVKKQTKMPQTGNI
jgi:hypothetical protein